MQYRILDRRTLQYRDGGYVRQWSIDNDYINSNNSTIDIVFAAKNANVGDVIFLIETSGAYDKGVITGIDNEDLKISYKGDKELFNDNIINPKAQEFEENSEISVAGTFGLDVVSSIIDFYWGKNVDPYKRIPITIQTIGDSKMYWTWQEAQINFVDWLISLFKDYSIIVNFDIDFDTSDKLEERDPKYIVTISAVNNDNDIIKDNVAMQTITYTKEALPEKTCCWVIDKDSQSVVTAFSGKNKFNSAYGFADSIIDENGDIIDQAKASVPQKSIVTPYISVVGGESYVLSWENGDNIERNISFYDRYNSVIIFNDGQKDTKTLKYSGVQGYFQLLNIPSNARKIRICYPALATNIQFESGTTPTSYEMYSYKAIYYLCVNSSGESITVNGKTIAPGEYYITPNYNDLNRILPVRTVYVEYDENSASEESSVEDIAKNELKLSSLNHAIEIEIPRDSKMFDFELAKFGDKYKIITKNGTITSTYSGRKESSESNVVTLLFGTGRLNFTDLINNTLRSRKYTKIYS